MSNHWILMWFFKKFQNYNYYWSMEYDVRISGNSCILWNYDGEEDFLFPREIIKILIICTKVTV